MRTLVAILALSPALLHAQAHSPAQPVSTPSLQASLTRPAVASAIPTSISSSSRVASTDARIIETVPFVSHSMGTTAFTRELRTVVLDVTVDRNGKPADVKVISSNDPFSNLDVIETVRQYRYQPATAGGVPVATHRTLTYNIEQPTEE